jgi:hypothetical protein
MMANAVPGFVTSRHPGGTCNFLQLPVHARARGNLSFGFGSGVGVLGSWSVTLVS